MSHNFERMIVERLEKPGWVTTRGVLRDPTGQADPEDYVTVEEVMHDLASRGVAALWYLILDEGGVQVLAAARPDLELDKELQQRNAAARAERYEPDGSSPGASQ
jgi:hypothetical protein